LTCWGAELVDQSGVVVVVVVVVVVDVRIQQKDHWGAQEDKLRDTLSAPLSHQSGELCVQATKLAKFTSSASTRLTKCTYVFIHYTSI